MKWEITKSLLEKISIMLQLFLITQQIDRIFKSLITAMKYFKHQFILIILSIFFLDAGAQNIQRYKDISFSYPDSILNIPYGSAQNLNGKTEELLLDLYSPGIADTATKRPLMIFIHGGGFQSNTKSGAYPNLICNGLAKRGYMVATINYRLGIPKTKTENEYADIESALETKILSEISGALQLQHKPALLANKKILNKYIQIIDNELIKKVVK